MGNMPDSLQPSSTAGPTLPPPPAEPQLDPMGAPPSPDPSLPPPPQAPSQAPEQKTPFWKSLLQGALNGIAGARGATSFGGGVAGGAAGDQEATQRQFNNNLQLKFASLQDAKHAADLTRQMTEDQHWNEDMKQKQDELGATNMRFFTGKGYKVVPIPRDSQSVLAHLGTNGGTVPPFTFHDSKNVYAVYPGEDKGWRGANELASAINAYPIPQDAFNQLPAAGQQAYAMKVNTTLKAMTPDQLDLAIQSYSAKPDADPQVLSVLTAQRALAQGAVDTADVKRGKDTADKIKVGVATAGARNDRYMPTTNADGTSSVAKASTVAASGGNVTPDNHGSMFMGATPDGHQVVGTQQELQGAGVKSISKIAPDEAGKVHVARQLVAPNGLFTAVANDISTLEKNNQLGPIASRWSDFASGKIGTGPEFASLRANMGLLATALMQAHVGARGSDQMREHFQHLADHRISDAATLRSALSSEFKYVMEKAAFIPKAGK